MAINILLLLLALCGGAEAARTGQKRSNDESKSGLPPASPAILGLGASDGVWVIRTYSVTITPLHGSGGVPVTPADRETACLKAHNLLNADMQMRHADGQLVWLVCSLEHGEVDGNPHLQLVYQLRIRVASDSHADKKRDTLKEKIWLKECVSVEGVDMRVAYKMVKKGNETYLMGYCQKGKGQAHCVILLIGVSDEVALKAFNFYMSKAAEFVKSNVKINKSPSSTHKELAFKVTNLFVLAAWFVNQHHLEPLSSFLTVPLVVAYALTTGNYRLDDSLVTGRTGAPMDVARSEAFFRLLMAGTNANISTLVPLVETILYGEVQEHPQNADINIGMLSMASEEELQQARVKRCHR